MIRLIKGEFKKIFHKKSFYIVTAIFILYTILTNVIYKSIDNYDFHTENVNINEYIEANNNLDLDQEEQLKEYISNLTVIELEEIKQKYFTNNQIYLIDEYLYELVYKSYESKYIRKNDEEYNLIRIRIDDYINKIAKDDWKYFADLKLEELKLTVKNINDDKNIERYNELISLTEYRIDNNISYDYDNYLNNALESLEINSLEYYNLLNKNNLSKEQLNRLEYLKEEYQKNKYILDNKVDINNGETLQAVLSNFSGEFGLFILIYIIMISGSIVSEEFNKGTIKYLFTKPYHRSTILTSKLFTVILMLPLIVIFMVLVELIIGGIILGFESLSVPILIYDRISNGLVSYNIFIYLMKLLFFSVPIYLILGILCFTIGTISLSTSAAITITFLFYLAGNVISNLALVYNLKLFKFFVSLHWDFSYLITLDKSPYGINPIISVLVLLIYISTMLCLAYVYFNKKDVKNI